MRTLSVAIAVLLAASLTGCGEGAGGGSEGASSETAGESYGGALKEVVHGPAKAWLVLPETQRERVVRVVTMGAYANDDPDHRVQKDEREEVAGAIKQCVTRTIANTPDLETAPKVGVYLTKCMQLAGFNIADFEETEK